MDHLAPTLFQRPDRVLYPLYVMTVVFNPVRYRTRWKLYEDFAKMIECSGAILYTCEVAYGDRQFVITDPMNPRHLQLRTMDELWLKENALNLLFERLPPDWQVAAWMDADIKPVRSDWANETLQALQHHKVVQMWSEAYDLNSNHEVIQKHHSFVFSWMTNEPIPPGGGYYYTKPDKTKVFVRHPGFCWAWRREALSDVGRFLDIAILGAGDNHMANGLVGTAESNMHPRVTPGYKKAVLQWQDRALRFINKDIGYVPGALVHFWHGPKVKRGYRTRWEILVRNKFDPYTDLKRDWQGLYRFDMDGSERMIHLRDEVRNYFRSRDEDSPS